MSWARWRNPGPIDQLARYRAHGPVRGGRRDGAGHLRAVEVRRFGKSIATFDLYDYLLRGDTRNDLRLETGDVVFVGVHGTRVQLMGAVRAAGDLRGKDGARVSPISCADAGGFRPDAQLKRLSVFRLAPRAERGRERHRGQ